MTEIERLTDEMKELAERTLGVQEMISVLNDRIITDEECAKNLGDPTIDDIKAYLAEWDMIKQLEEIIEGFNFEIKLRTERIRELEKTEDGR